MSRTFLIAAVLNWGVAVALVGIGIDYMRDHNIKPHHAEMLKDGREDKQFQELTPRTQTLILTLMHGTGLLSLETGVAMAVLLTVPFRRREPWSRPALLIVAGTTLVFALIGTIKVNWETGGTAPWSPHVAMIVALAVAFVLTRDFRTSVAAATVEDAPV